MPIVDYITISKLDNVIGTEYCCFIYTQNAGTFVGYGFTKHEAVDDALRGMREHAAALGEK